jgi:hypothetical protein
MKSLVHAIRVLMPNTFILSASSSYGYLSKTKASWHSSTNESQSLLMPWRCNTASLNTFGANSRSWRFLSLALVTGASCWISFLKLCSFGQSPDWIISRHFRYVSNASAESTTYATPRWSLCPTVACVNSISLDSWKTSPAWNIFLASCLGGDLLTLVASFVCDLAYTELPDALALSSEQKESGALLCGTFLMASQLLLACG